MRKLPENAYGIVYLKDWVPCADSSGHFGAYLGRLELLQQEEFGITKLSDSSWGIRIFARDAKAEAFVPGCQIRCVELLGARPKSVNALNVRDLDALALEGLTR